ncbi:hypothetical protein AcW2_000644 [Taiwanofungus camphoratus]|nr:hypothetical protein AcW2_000644 [Antrodia cinnamomea]
MHPAEENDTPAHPKWTDEVDALTEQNAAIQIQRTWRRKKRRTFLQPDFLWTDAAKHARLKVNRDAAERGMNDRRARWRRAMFLASRLQDGNPAFTKSSPGGANLSRKRLDTQYWLELVDGKHRYGANRTYGTAHYVLVRNFQSD